MSSWVFSAPYKRILLAMAALYNTRTLEEPCTWSSINIWQQIKWIFYYVEDERHVLRWGWADIDFVCTRFLWISLLWFSSTIRPTFKFNMLSNLFFTLKVNAWLVCLWVSCKDSSIGGIFQVMYTMLALCLPWMPSVAQIQIYPLNNEVCWSSTNWYLVGTWTGTYVLPTKLYMNSLLSSCFETVLHRSSLVLGVNQDIFNGCVQQLVCIVLKPEVDIGWVNIT